MGMFRAGEREGTYAKVRAPDENIDAPTARDVKTGHFLPRKGRKFQLRPAQLADKQLYTHSAQALLY